MSTEFGYLAGLPQEVGSKSMNRHVKKLASAFTLSVLLLTVGLQPASAATQLPFIAGTPVSSARPTVLRL